jgi:hypothetical protein
MAEDRAKDEDRLSIPLAPEDALRALLAVDPDSKPKPCPKTWQGKRCKLEAGHFGPCQYDL